MIIKIITKLLIIKIKKMINNTKLNNVFSGVLTVDQSSLGFIDLTGKRVTTTGFVESGIRNIFEESADISGRFSVLKETIPFNSNIIKTGHINDLCGNREPLYGSGNKIGVKKGNFFIEYSGNFTESNIQNNETIFSMSLSFQKDEEGLSHSIEMPKVPPPEELKDEEWDA